MDRIAIISDIHSNMPALEAVLADIKERGIKRIICLGDLVGKGANPKEVVDIIRNTCETVVKGNWDYLVAEVADGETMKWNNIRLDEEQIDFLKNLPLYIEFYISGKLVRMCHAAPNDVFLRIRSNCTVEEKSVLFNPPKNGAKECDVLIYGDIHVAYIQNFNQKTLINVGSVGVPLQVSQASYAILEGKLDERTEAPISFTLVRVPYDVEKAVRDAKEAKVPNFEKYSHELNYGQVYRP
ncbi:metallophosphoesterase family protein [Clostridium manihotivorum]|uniref:Metallophosphatase family protein n=1 Tax=Clostridium manihotivorum TaxID=2320868 RepID=A0A410DU04_9CLOT|nr:metallophosphoesterase family protein [Clostridium manihotivorum]QAA32539.1 metallophosphatase family protein [Clostridium manihotivorum]